ncbi:MAG: phytoene desaturase family protein, partial [Prevotella sp.]
MKKYDVIIIGSGLGGLECAYILARRGMSVLVLEQAARPGGCMQSYQRGGLDFDTGFHYVGGLAEGQSMYDIFKYMGLMELPWQRLDADGFD